MTTDAFMTIFKLENCARCGGIHENLVAKPFERPVELEFGTDTIIYSHWTMCPATQDPILVGIRETHPAYDPAVELRHNQRINPDEAT